MLRRCDDAVLCRRPNSAATAPFASEPATEAVMGGGGGGGM
jgi:hypothetical protein